MPTKEPEYDTVIELSKNQLDELEFGKATIRRTVDGNTYSLTTDLKEAEKKISGVYVAPNPEGGRQDIANLRNGEVKNYHGQEISVVYDGAQKCGCDGREEIAEYILDNIEWYNIELGCEVLDMLGYELSKEYTLVDKR